MGGSSSRDEGFWGTRQGSSSYGGRGRQEDQPPYAGGEYPSQPVYQSYHFRDGGYSLPRHENYHPPYSPQTPSRSAALPKPRRRVEGRYSKIADEYSSMDEVTEALATAGLESSNLIVGVDFTLSNEWRGRNSFNRRSLHSIGDVQNPYEQAISIIGRTLSAFDEDNLIPSFGFGDVSTHDQDVFSFYPDERPCDGFEEVLSRYKEIVPRLQLAGPTSFAPIIETAMTIVERSGGQYHVLLIITDGEVRNIQKQNTVDAIVRASEFPLSIVLVGVGDGPWDTMREFDDNIPARAFDNFQFVNFTEIMSKTIPQSRRDAAFALAALMEIPSQYKATLEMGLLGHVTGRSPERVPLPPPIETGFGGLMMASFPQRAPPAAATPPPPPVGLLRSPRGKIKSVPSASSTRRTRRLDVVTR